MTEISSDNAQKLATSLGASVGTADQVIDALYNDILHTVFQSASQRSQDKTNPIEAHRAIELMEKVRSVSSRNPGGSFDDADSMRTASTLVFEKPEDDNVSVFQVAARRVAQDLGLNYREAPSSDADAITRNDFVFMRQDTDDVIASMESSVSSSMQGKAHTSIFDSLRSAGGGVLLFTDFLEQPGYTQNVGLSLMEEGRFRGTDLTNTCMGVTAKMGALKTAEGRNPYLPVALRNRLKIVAVSDSLEATLEDVSPGAPRRSSFGR